MKKGEKYQNSDQKRIGFFIKSLREGKNLTQKEFSELLNTSQSAVARMENGNQNFTSQELAKISSVLNRKIISLSDSIDFEIIGGKKLSGTICTNTSKNGAMALMSASLINQATTTLFGIPRIEEVNRMIEILESIGVSVKWKDSNILEIRPPNEFKIEGLKTQSAGKIRSGLMLIGGLIHFVETFEMPRAGGCKMGDRTIGAHKFALEELGIFMDNIEGFYKISKEKRLHGGKIIMYEMSDTATVNAIIAASLIPEETEIKFASSNYQVQEVCYFLQRLGVNIQGIGTSRLKIFGLDKISQNIDYFNGEDPIESMMFITAGLVTNSDLKIKRCPIDFIELELYRLEKMGLRYEISPFYLARNQKTKLVDVKIFKSKLISSPDKIHALPYPGINVDNLPFFVPIATQAQGTTLIHDWMWENRALYFTELNRLGANVQLADPHRVFVTGPSELKPAQVVCPPALRPAMIILIAMLSASGKSILRNVYSIRRGYEEIAERLNSIGADVKVINSI